MKRFRLHLSLYALVAAVIFGAASMADAQRRNEREVRDIVRSLNSKIDDFKFGIDYQMRSSSANRQEIDDLTRSVDDLQSKVDMFDENLRARRENRDDVNQIIDAAKDVDSFLRTSRQNQRIQTDWNGVRDLVGRLASNYGVTPDWSGRASTYPSQPRDNYPTYSSGSGSMNNGLTGTYSLDTGRSERIADVIANTNASGAQRQDLESKLEAPSQIALLVRGDEVTLATSNGSPMSFRADGSEKLETVDGRDVRVRATLRSNIDLSISSIGGATDYTINFISTDNGRTLKVTRRITTDYLPETVFAESVYTKTDAVAGLGIDANATVGGGIYSTNDPNDTGRNPQPSISQGRTGDFIIPNGTVVTAMLENEINTKVSQNFDKFKMTVQSPDEFRGASIEGHISGVGRSGQVSGRSNVTFNFERITLRNGQTYEFGGVLQSVKDQNGKLVKVDTEGTAKGDSQTKETAKRGGLGAGLGALIGVIAGGGKGAAIGAIIGGGVGAGSVVVQGRDDIQLMKGSTITIQATSPIRRDQPVSEN